MPRVYHVKKARKDNPVAKKGESYYWWKFAFGPKCFSKTRPKRSQLTQSEFLSWLYDFEDDFEARFKDIDDPQDLETAIEDACSEISEQRDMCQDNLDNMPDHLQDTSDAGMTLQERIDQLDDWENQLQSINIPDKDGDDFKESMENAIQEAIDTNGCVG